MTFNEYPDDEMMAMNVANQIAGELRQALAMQERALLVVPGGSTPGPVFDSLCEAALDWARVDVLPSDERWVPEDHARSNTRLIRERLLVGKAAAATCLPLYAPASAPEEVLADLENAISPALPISVAVLGMGVDMHVASIFPTGDKRDAALASDAPVLLAMRVPTESEVRVTLSARVLQEAMRLHILITGEQKREALEAARSLSPQEAPVRAVLEEAVIHWTA